MSDMKKCKIDGCFRSVRTAGLCDPHYKRKLRHGDPLGGKTDRGAALKWLAENKDFSGDECLIWPFGKTRGYAVLKINGVNVIISRMLLTERIGPPPKQNLQAAHLCGQGNRGCVNPKHLVWATRKQNEFHKDTHGTRPRGQDVKGSKLTERDVLHIKSSTDRQVQIARTYGISQSLVSRIKSGQHWKHI